MREEGEQECLPVEDVLERFRPEEGDRERAGSLFCDYADGDLGGAVEDSLEDFSN